MTVTSRHRGRRALAVGTALTLGTLGALATIAPAHAASIDTQKQGSIIIHKYENPGNGQENPSGTGKLPDTAPIAGVVFEYCPITDVNLLDGTNAGWNAIKAVTPTQLLAAAGAGTPLPTHTLGACTALPATDATGTATSAKLPLGAYLVREISAPSNVISPAAPFIMTLPSPMDHTNLTGDWVYDVNVYPKNSIAAGPVKNVVNQPTGGLVLGAPIEYQVTQLIPALAAGQTYDKFILTDTLDSKLTPLTTAPVTVKAGTATLVSGTDYTATWAGQTLTVTFLPAGLAKLKAGENVVFDFQAKANAVGAIDNTAYVNLNDFKLNPGSQNDPTKGSPSSIATTRWGNLVVQKVNKSNQADGLAGAKFNLYMGTTDSNCTADITGLTRVNLPGTNTPFELTSDSSGLMKADGLWIGDTEKTVAADGTVSNTTVAGHDFLKRCYVLQEIVAPNGFVLPTGTGALTEVLINAGDNGTGPLVKIDNQQQGVPELPFTGSSVQLAMTIGGIALIVIAIGGVLMVRRRNASRESA